MRSYHALDRVGVSQDAYGMSFDCQLFDKFGITASRSHLGMRLLLFITSGLAPTNTTLLFTSYSTLAGYFWWGPDQGWNCFITAEWRQPRATCHQQLLIALIDQVDKAHLVPLLRLLLVMRINTPRDSVECERSESEQGRTRSTPLPGFGP